MNESERVISTEDTHISIFHNYMQTIKHIQSQTELVLAYLLHNALFNSEGSLHRTAEKSNLPALNSIIAVSIFLSLVVKAECKVI